MRTTISIDDHLLERAKRDARLRGQTLGQYVEDAIRRGVNDDAEKKEAYEIPVYRPTNPGVRPGVDLTSNRSLF